VAARAALCEREITGKGQRVSSAPFESAAFLMSTHMAGMAATGLDARPMPARRGAWAIYEVFETAGDGELVIGVTSDQQWVRLVEEFGLQDLAAVGGVRLAPRRGGGDKGRSACFADRVRRRTATPRHHAPAAAHGRAQCRNSRGGGFAPAEIVALGEGHAIAAAV
jgi:crotonobetainyl-CoA:carnitine CoA-transferase CaiB-like acyl-CoA transferase